MKIFIIENEPDKNNFVRFEGKDYHYLVHVRRLAEGEFFPALLPNSGETLVQIISINNGILTGKCAAEIPPEEQEHRIIPKIILFQALPKGGKMDLIIRQAAEGGITEIVPFVSEFSIGGAGGQKYSRWEKIIKEARQQSGSKIATSIKSPLSFNELFDYWKKLDNINAIGLIFHHIQIKPNKYSGGLENESLHGYLNSNPNIVALAVGPEGGFSDGEVSAFMENGFKPFTIGNTVLRTETAALYCAAAIRILLLERDSWELKQAQKLK